MNNLDRCKYSKGYCDYRSFFSRFSPICFDQNRTLFYERVARSHSSLSSLLVIYSNRKLLLLNKTHAMHWQTPHNIHAKIRIQWEFLCSSNRRRQRKKIHRWLFKSGCTVSVLTSGFTKNVKYEYLWYGIDILGGKPVVFNDENISIEWERKKNIKSFDKCNWYACEWSFLLFLFFRHEIIDDR